MGKTDDDIEYELYLGDWLDTLGMPVGEAAEVAKCDQSYISNMKGKRKANPSALILLRISIALGITVNDFYQKPPTVSETAAFDRLSPKAQQTILRSRRKRA